MTRATCRATPGLPDSSVPRRCRHSTSSAVRRGAITVLPLCEIGCVLVLVLVSALILIATGNVHQEVFSEIATSRGTGFSRPVHRMAVDTTAGTALIRTGRYDLQCLDLGTAETVDLPGLDTADVAAISQSQDGAVLAIGYLDGSVCFRHTTASGTRLSSLRGHPELVHDLCLSADGRLAVSTGNDGLVLIWDVAGARVAQRLALPAGSHNGGVVAAFPTGAELVAAATRDGTVCCWRTNDGGHLMRSIPLPGICSIAFSPDSRRLLAASTHTRSIHCLDALSGREEWMYRNPCMNGMYFCVAVAPDGRTAVAGSGPDGGIDLLDMASGEHLRRVPAHDTFVSAVQFSPDGRRLFSSSQDGTVAVWETNRFTELGPRIGPLPLDWN